MRPPSPWRTDARTRLADLDGALPEDQGARVVEQQADGEATREGLNDAKRLVSAAERFESCPASSIARCRDNNTSQFRTLER